MDIFQKKPSLKIPAGAEKKGIYNVRYRTSRTNYKASLMPRNGEEDGRGEKKLLVEVLSFDPQMSHAKDLWFSSHH